MSDALAKRREPKRFRETTRVGLEEERLLFLNGLRLMLSIT